MGRAFASLALERGHEVTVWNRSPGKAADMVSRGAIEVSSVPEAVARAEATLVVVADDAAVRNVCLTDGALAALADGAVLINVSTVSPELARELAAAGPADSVLDAPVMGSPSAIASAGGRFMIGGAADVVHRLAPLWGDLGAGYTHCGPSGSGAVLKLVSNLQLVIGVAALAEAIATAREHGIEDGLLREIFADSPVTSPATRVRLDMLLDAEHPGWFPPELARKDVRLAMKLAEEKGVSVRLGPAAENLLTAVISDRAWPDFSAVIEALTN